MKQNLTLRTDTSTYTIQDVIEEINECVGLIAELGYPDLRFNKYSVIFSTRKVKTYATCTKLGERQYKITINQHYLRLAASENVHNTIMHEVIHSVPGCMNHKDPWKRVAAKVNANYKFTTITRLGHDSNYWDEYASQHRKKMKYGYVLSCNNCGHVWHYKVRCDTIKKALSGHCSCPYCGRSRFSCETIPILYNY